MSKQRQKLIAKRRNLPRFLFFFLLVIALISCSAKTKQLFFDIPPPSPQELADEARIQAQLEAADNQKEEDGSQTPMFGLYDKSQPRPEIESIPDWDKVLELLPKDYKNQPDWSAAIEQGIVRPRPGSNHRSLLATTFKYDFIIEELAEKPKNEGYFPHSAHTQWLDCKNCHGSIYPFRRNPATMKEMRAGASCGKCHGKVAFSLRQCKRCHLNR